MLSTITIEIGVSGSKQMSYLLSHLNSKYESDV